MENKDKQNLKDGTQPGNLFKIIGVGEDGIHTVNHMYGEGIDGVSFAVCDLNKNLLNCSPVPCRIQLGMEGIGYGNTTKWGHFVTSMHETELSDMLDDGTQMAFVMAGLSEETGTWAAPEIARICKHMDILTVGIVNVPLECEGSIKSIQALKGIKEMARHTDALFLIRNSTISKMHPGLSLIETAVKVEESLCNIVKSITEIVNEKGMIDLDFNDVKTALEDGGMAILCTGEGEGEQALENALEAAANSPLLQGNDLFKSKKLLLNISIAGDNASDFLSMEAMGYFNDFMGRFGEDFQMQWGLTVNTNQDKPVKATILATGFELKDMLPDGDFHARALYGLPLDEELLKKLIEKLSDPTAQGKEIYPWEDVLESMKARPEKVFLSDNSCPDCGEKLIQVYFRSPDWTWKDLCGRAGDMLICPKCHAQQDFRLTIMN